MRVRTIKAHANPYGRGRGKQVGTEYDLPAGEAKAEIMAGNVERVGEKKRAKG